MVLRESWTYAALLVELLSASGHGHIPLYHIESWLASSHGLIGFLCHVTVAGVMVAGVTVDIRLLRFVMELGFIFNIVAFVKD